MSRVPIRLPAKSKRPVEREKDIQKTILEGLSALRIWHVRMNSGAMLAEYGGKKRMLRFGRKGMADVLALVREEILYDDMAEINRVWPVWFECKRLGKKQTPEQIAFQSEVEAEGHKYFVVHSWDEVLEVLKFPVTG